MESVTGPTPEPAVAKEPPVSATGGTNEETARKQAHEEQSAGRTGGNDNRPEAATKEADGGVPAPVSATRVSVKPRPANIGTTSIASARSANENNPEKPPVPTDPTAENPSRSGGAASAIPANRPRGMDAPRLGKPDDLKKIKGVGPKIEKTLHDLGIYHFDQIAAWTPAEIDWVDDYLSFKGRIGRDNWIGQAADLARAGKD